LKIRNNLAVYQLVRFDEFGDAPGLGDTAFRPMGWVAIEYLTDLSKTAILG